LSARNKIQIKDLSLRSISPCEVLASHHTLIFCSSDESGATSNSSKIALSLLERIGIDACRIDVVAGSAVEQFLQNYSGWQYFPQLYVCAEFVGGNTIIPEFFRSG